MRWQLRRIARAAILSVVTAAAPTVALAQDDSRILDRVRISRANVSADEGLAQIRSALATRFTPESAAGDAHVRVLSVRPIPDDPTRFEATVYDAGTERGYELLLNAVGAEIGRKELALQPEISEQEVRDAIEIVTRSSAWSRGIREGTHFVYEAMPPFSTDKNGRRLINVGVMARPAGSWDASQNEIVSVHLPSGQIVRNDGGAPPTAVAPLEICGPPHDACGAPQGDCTSLFHFEWPAVDPVWKFDAMHPACTSSVQGDGTGLELRNVKYRDHLVIKTVHIPVINVKYTGDVCGPYRDWLHIENCFTTAGTPVGTTGFAVSSGSAEPTTICEAGTDGGNFLGVAIHDAGDSLLLVTEANAGWYRYDLQYRLSLDGMIETTVGFDAAANSCTCNAHMHHAYWRYEFAPDGSETDQTTGIATLERLIPGSTDQWAQITTETKFNRPTTNWEQDRLRIRNPATGTEYILVPGLHDGSAAGNSFAQADTWALAYNAGQINDPNSADAIQIDSWLNGEALGATKRLVLWYRAGYLHDEPGGGGETCERLTHRLYFRQACRGQLSVSPSTVSCSDALTAVVDDSDLIGDETLSVTARSQSEPDGQSFLLVETPPGSGRFEGLVSTTTDPVSPSDDLLTAAHGETIEVDYDDVDACGTAHVIVQATATTDCAPPILSNVRAEDITDTSATLRWDTDEPADGHAAYGLVAPPATPATGAEALSTVHSAQLQGLSACTRYLYSVTSSDPGGNAATNDNGGSYYSFDTYGREFPYGPDDLESSTTGWTVTTTGGSSWNVTTCRSSSATHAFKAGSSTGCPGSYAADTDTYLTSPVLALGGGTGHRLRFREYVSTQLGNDFGRVEILTVPGGTWTTLAQSTGVSGGWQTKIVDLSAFAGQDVQIRFWFHSDSTSAIEGWYLDDIEVSKAVPCSPNLVEDATTATATCPAGGSDGAIDPGEDVILEVVARNFGRVDATGVSATLTAVTPGVFVMDSVATFPDVPESGGAASSDAPHFAFTVTSEVPCPGTLDFNIQFTSDQGQWSGPLQLQVGSGGPATHVVASSNTPIPIPDDSIVSDTLVVTSAGTINDVNVTLSASHTYDADLDIVLVSPTGERINLTTDNGGSANNYTSTTFDDQATTPIEAGAAPFTGTFRPEETLSSLNGLAAGGTWTLEVKDDASGDTGTLLSWSVEVAAVEPASCAGCAVSAPGEVHFLEWVGLDGLQWTPATEGRWYEMLRGDSSRLAPLADAGTDACIRWTGLGGASGPIVSEIPGPEDPLFWYLVTAWNGGGRGEGGSGTAGPRVLNPQGPCP